MVRSKKFNVSLPPTSMEFYSRMKRIEQVEIFKTGKRSRKDDVVDISIIKIGFDK